MNLEKATAMRPDQPLKDDNDFRYVQTLNTYIMTAKLNDVKFFYCFCDFFVSRIFVSYVPLILRFATKSEGEPKTP